MRCTHTFAVLELSPAAFEEIEAKLRAAGYDHAFVDDNHIDMHGIGVKCEEACKGSQWLGETQGTVQKNHDAPKAD